MALRMASPTRRKGSSVEQSRNRVPADLRDRAPGTRFVVNFPALKSDTAATVHVMVGRSEVVFSLRTRNPVVAKARKIIANAVIETHWATLRSNQATTISGRQSDGYAGDLYNDIVMALNDNPEIARGVFYRGADTSLTIPTHDAPDVTVTPHENDVAPFVEAVKAKHGLVNVDAAGRAKLNRSVAAALADVGDTLRRNAHGDWNTGTIAARFPPVERKEPSKPVALPAEGPSWDTLITTWERGHEAADKQATSRPQFRSAVERFATWAKKPPLAVGKSDIRAYVDKRLSDGVKGATVTRSDISNLRRLFVVADNNELTPVGHVNPTKGVEVPKISGTSVTALTSEPRGYTDEEAALILAAAAANDDPLFHWVPLLLAYSGARVAEIVGLRACDVKVIDGIVCFHVTPEAGRHVKTRDSIRLVPIHRAVLDAGFRQFVATKTGTERLFATSSPRAQKSKAQRDVPVLIRRNPKTGKAVPPPPKKSVPSAATAESIAVLKPGKTSVERLRRWIRDDIAGLVVGAKHNLPPNHAWRHRIKTKARDAEIDSVTIDAICGHAPGSVGAGYGEVSVTAKAAALAKLL